MRVNDGHTLSLTIDNDGDIKPSVNCPHQGKEATEDIKCSSAAIGETVDDCAVAAAVDDVGTEAIVTDGDDFNVTVYPIPVEFTYEDDDLIVVPVATV